MVDQDNDSVIMSEHKQDMNTVQAIDYQTLPFSS